MTVPESNPHSPASPAQASTDGRLLGWLVAGFYALFTLLPDSNSLMVSWPWVFIWQVGLLCPWLWGLGLIWQQQRLPRLGNGLDWLAGLFIVGLGVSSLLAEFPNQARWYSWASLCFIAALYAVSAWVKTPQRRWQLLVGQGYLNLAFILVSLGLWVSQTLLPELVRLRQLRQQYGVNLPFDFSVLELRNWAPIGHQNYVAGYLLLALPLLIGLSVVQRGRQRQVWMIATGLGLLDLYTTSSRGGWLALVVLAILSFPILLLRSSLPKRWLGAGGAIALLAITLLVLANNRLKTVVTGVGGQAGGDFAYRTITTTTGWQMGLSHWWAGIAPGGVPVLFQQYRPGWAGREAELAYQLHSTPAQLFAELGVWGVAIPVAAIAALIYLGGRWLRTTAGTVLPRERSLIWSLYAGLFAYTIFSLTDYQLDNICISGTLVIYLAVLAQEFRQTFTPETTAVTARPRSVQIGVWAGIGLLIVTSIWLIPIHIAWNMSSLGFAALSRQDAEGFVQRLERSHQLAAWEPYYPYQLAANLGNFAIQTLDPQLRQTQLDQAITWFKTGLATSPYQEFGHSNLAWLLLTRDPGAAGQAFAQSARLMPAKRGVFYGLGLSLLAQGKTDVAVTAIALEVLRDPLLITSPLWRQPQLQSLYQPVLSQLETRYTTLLGQSANSTEFTAYLRQNRGAVRWWRGDLSAAQQDWDVNSNPLSQVVLELAAGKTSPARLSDIANSGVGQVIAAWLTPAKRSELMQQAWVMTTRSALPADLINQLVEGMNASTSFDQWVKQNAPSQQYRRERAGFGVLSRHIDGPPPTDFLTVVDNVVMTQLLEPLLPSPVYSPELDRALQPDRDRLLASVLKGQ